MNFFLISLLLTVTYQSHIQLMSNITVPQDRYIEINYSSIASSTGSFDEGDLLMSIEFRLKNYGDSAYFDIFKLSKDDYTCYKDATTKPSQVCDFLNNLDKTYLGKNEIKIDFLQTKIKNINSNDDFYFIVDNTKFPDNGASYYYSFELEIIYHIDIKPSDSYYIRTISLAIAFGIIFVFSLGLLIYCWLRFRKHNIKIYYESQDDRDKSYN